MVAGYMWKAHCFQNVYEFVVLDIAQNLSYFQYKCKLNAKHGDSN